MSQNENIIKLKTFCASVLALPKVFVGLIKRNIKISENKKETETRTKPCIFLIGTPGYGNLGDQIIAVAEKQWLKDYYPDYELREFTHEQLMADKNCKLLLSQINKNDLIFLQGGGNLNDLYLNCESIRRTVISECFENRIVMFQQSIFFSDTQRGKEIQAETCRVYNGHKKFTLITRDDRSYALAKEIFSSLQVLEYPDMATYLFGKLSLVQTVRNGVLICLRDDAERFYSDGQTASMLDALKAENALSVADTNLHRTIATENRLLEITTLLNTFAKHKVVVTDRFHGMIFAVLSGTPCVALRSSDHKITEGIKWFKDYDGIYYAKNIEDVPALVEKAKHLKNFNTPDFSHYFEEMYRQLNI